MNFYKTFYFISILLLPSAYLQNRNLRIVERGSAPASVCKIGLEFFVKLNNTSDEDFHVELIPDECCLKVDDEEDCNSLQIIGECSDVIPKETTKTLTLVAPLIDPFEREGYCIIHLDSRPLDNRRNIMRDTTNIQFDTRIKEYNSFELKHCKNTDENPLDDCKPVNCETYYNGRRSYFDKHTKRCTEVPHCVDRNVAYDPKYNKCVKEAAISDEDLQFIKSLTEKERQTKDILIINTAKRLENFTDNSFKELNNVNETGNFLKGKILYYAAAQYLLSNKYTLAILFLVVTVQCCLILTMLYCFTNNSACCNRKKVVRKFFNYRQDESVTTPLIATNNMDTDTTEFDYINESSNADKKIKCYKACQKEQKAKMCMPDDILLKCLNRRDWSAQPISADKDSIPPESAKKIEEPVLEINENKTEITRVVSNDIEGNSKSEKEIKCHDYNVDFKAVDVLTENSKQISDTTDKGAQACFSNDSIDDFLSERGLVFLGENASKYSFSSSSTQDKSSLTNVTSKTSKNNILKNILSYLKKSTTTTASDPGVKKVKSKNLEFLHISHASIYSSRSELNNIKGIKFVKESRSTF